MKPARRWSIRGAIARTRGAQTSTSQAMRRHHYHALIRRLLEQCLAKLSEAERIALKAARLAAHGERRRAA